MVDEMRQKQKVICTMILWIPIYAGDGLFSPWIHKSQAINNS